MASADILRAAHSLLPWQVHRSSVTGGINVVYEPNGFGRTVVLTGFALGSGKVAEANTEFVYRACNAHYQMLEALKEVRSLVCEAAETGFNCFDGSWAERLYTNNGRLSAAIAAAEREAGR